VIHSVRALTVPPFMNTSLGSAGVEDVKKDRALSMRAV
jgi:hypothetical protein